MDDNRSIKENEIITQILSNDDILSLSIFLIQTGKDLQYDHKFHLNQWITVLEKFDDLLNTWSCKITLVDDIVPLSTTTTMTTEINNNSKQLICSILYFLTILLSSCEGKRQFNLFRHCDRLLKAVDTDIVELTLTVLFHACCLRSKLVGNESGNGFRYNDDENWTKEWKKRNIDLKENVELPSFLADDIFNIFEGLSFLAVDYRITDYINGRLPQGLSSISSEIMLSYPSNTNNDDNNKNIHINVPVIGTDNNDIEVTMKTILSDNSLSTSHSLSLLSALRAAQGLKGDLDQRIRISHMKFLCLYILIHMKNENEKLNALFLTGGSLVKDVIAFADVASEVYSDIDLQNYMYSLATLALQCSIILLENKKNKNLSGIAEDLGVSPLNSDDQHDSAWTSILFSANVQVNVINSIVATEIQPLASGVEDNNSINTISWSSLTNQHRQELSSLVYYRVALDFLATVMSQRGHNDNAISDAPVIGSVINFVDNSIPSFESLLSRFVSNRDKGISKDEAYLVGTIVQAVSCLKLCFRSDNRNTYPIAFRECEGLQTIVKIIEVFGTHDYSIIGSINSAFVAILESSVSILAQNISASRRSARGPADSGVQVLYQTYFIKLCTYVFQTSFKDNEFLWIGLLKAIKFAVSIEPAFLSQFLNSSYSNLFAETLRKDTAVLVTSRGGILLPLAELVIDLLITNEGQQFVLRNRIVQLIIESLVKSTSLYHDSKDGLAPKKVAHIGKIIAEIMRNVDSFRTIIQNTIQAIVVTVCNECQLQFSDLSLIDPQSESKCNYFNDMNNPRMKVLQKLTNICSFIENLMPDQNRRHYRDLQRELLSDEMIKSLLNVYHCILPYSRQLFTQLSLRSSTSGSSMTHYGYYPAAKALTAVVRIAAELVPHVVLPELLKCIDETLAMISNNKREFSTSSGGKEEQMIDFVDLGVSEILPKRRRSRGSSLGQQGANVLILGVLDSIPNKCFFDHEFDANDSINEIYIWKFLSSVLNLEWLSLVLSFCLRSMQRSQGSSNWISGGKDVLRRLFAFYRSSLLEVCRFAATKWIPKPIIDCRIKKSLVNSPVLAEFTSSEDEEIEERKNRVPKQYLLRVIDMTEAVFYESFEIEKSRVIAHAEIGTTYIAFERKHNGQGTIRYRTAEGWISESRRDHHRDPILEVIDIPTMESDYSPFQSSIPELITLEAMTLRESASHAMGRVHGTLKHVAVYLSRLLVGDSTSRSFGDVNRANNISPIAPVLASSLTKIMSGLLSHPLDCLPESSTPTSLHLFKVASSNQLDENFKEDQTFDKQQGRRQSGGKGRKHGGYHSKEGTSSGGGPGSIGKGKNSITDEDDESPKESIEINQAALSLYQGTVMKQIFSSVMEDRHGSVNTYLLRAFIAGGVLESFVDVLGVVLASMHDAIDNINDTKTLSVEGRCALYALPHIFSVMRKIVAHDALANSPVNATMNGLSDYIGTFDIDDFIYNAFYPIALRLLPIFQNHSLTRFPADVQQDWHYVITEMILNLQSTTTPPPLEDGNSDDSGELNDPSQRQVSSPQPTITEFMPEASVVDNIVDMGFPRESVLTAIMQIRSNDSEVIMEYLTSVATDSEESDLAAAMQLSLASGPSEQIPDEVQNVDLNSVSDSINNLEVSAVVPDEESSMLLVSSPAPLQLPRPPIQQRSLPRERFAEDSFSPTIISLILPPSGDERLRDSPLLVESGRQPVRSGQRIIPRPRDPPSPNQSKPNEPVGLDEAKNKNDRFKSLAKLFRASIVSSIIEISTQVEKISAWQPCASSDSMQLICKFVNFFVQMNQTSFDPDEISTLMSSLIKQLSEVQDYNPSSFGSLFLLLSVLRCSSIHPLLDKCYPLDEPIISNMIRAILPRLKYDKEGNAPIESSTSWYSTALLVLNELMMVPLENNEVNDEVSVVKTSTLANAACLSISTLLKPKKITSKVVYPEIYDVIMSILTSDKRLDAEQYQSVMLIISTLLDDLTYVHKFLGDNGITKLLSINVAKAPNMSNSFVSTMLLTKILHSCMDSKTELRSKIKAAIQNFLTGKGVFVPHVMNKTRRTLNYFLTKMTPLLVRYPADFASVFTATCTICSSKQQDSDNDEFYVKINDKTDIIFNGDIEDESEFEGRLESIVMKLINFVSSDINRKEFLFSQSDVLSALSDCIPCTQKVTTSIAKTIVSQTNQNIADFLIATFFIKDCDSNDPEQMTNIMTFQAACRFLIMMNSHRGVSRKMVLGSVIKHLKIFSTPKPNIVESERVQVLTRLAVLISHMTEVNSKTRSSHNTNAPLSLDTLQVLISSGICELISKAIISLMNEDSSPVKERDDAIKALLIPLELITRPKLLPHINRIKERLNKRERASSNSTTGSESKLNEVDSPREIDSRGIDSNGDEIITLHDIEGDEGQNDTTFRSVALGTSDNIGDDEHDEDDDEEENDEEDDDGDEGDEDGDEEDDDDEEDDEGDEEDEDGDEVEIMDEDYGANDPQYSEILGNIYNESIPSRLRTRDVQSPAHQLLAGVFLAAENILGAMDASRNGRGEGGSNNFSTPPDQIRPETSFFASMPRPGSSFLHRNFQAVPTQQRGIPPRWPAVIDGLEPGQARNGLDRWDYIASRAQTASANSNEDMFGIDVSIPAELVSNQRNITSLHPLLIRADEVNGGVRNARPLPTPQIYDNRMIDFFRGGPVIPSNNGDIGETNNERFDPFAGRSVPSRNALSLAFGLAPGPRNETTEFVPYDDFQPSGNSHHVSMIQQVEGVLRGLAVPTQLEDIEHLWSTSVGSTESLVTQPLPATESTSNPVDIVVDETISATPDVLIDSPMDSAEISNVIADDTLSTEISVIANDDAPSIECLTTEAVHDTNNVSEVTSNEEVPVTSTTETENINEPLGDVADIVNNEAENTITLTENAIEVNEHRIPCPVGYDESVFYALPDFMQQEIVEQQVSSTSNEQLQQLALSAGYDFDTLMSLPENIRQEILDQARRDQDAASGAANNDSTGAEDMDNASFLVSLPQNLREEVLLSADAAFMETLPPQLQAEANLIRERSAIQFLNRENAQQLQDEAIPNPRSGERWRRRASPGPAPAAASNNVVGFMNVPSDDVDETLIPSELLPVVAKLINRESLDNQAQHLLNRLLNSMCKYPLFRDYILKLLVGVLSEEQDIVKSTITTITNTGTITKISPLLINLFNNENKVEKGPSLISDKSENAVPKSSIRFILALTLLIASNPSAAYDFLRNRVERYGTFKIENSKTGNDDSNDLEKKTNDMRLKKLTSTSEDESSNSLLEVIIGLFGKRQWKDKANDLLVLSSFISAATDQLDNLKDDPSSEEIVSPPVQSGTVPVSIPRIILSKHSLGCLCDVLISDCCTQTIFDHITLVISRLSKIENNNIHLTNLIVDVAQDLAEQSEVKLHQFLRVLGNDNDKDDGSESKVLKSNSLPISEAGGRQHERMLRVIQTLNSMAERTKSSIVSVIPYENFSSIWSALEKVLMRLNDFLEEDEDDIGTARKPQTALTSILSRLQPAIETFFIINACDVMRMANDSNPSSPNKSPEKAEANQKATELTEKSTLDDVLRKATTNLVFPGEKHRRSSEYNRMNISLFDDAGNESVRLQKSRSIRLVLSGASQSVSSVRSQRLLAFVHNHKSVLNLLISTKPQMLDSSLASLIRVPQLRSYLEFENKRKYFFNELRGMERGRGNIHLNLRRDQVYLDSFHQLRMRTADEMRGSLRVNFQGEEGVDAGGLTREWYVVISKEIFNAHYGLFVSLDGGSTFQPSSFSGQWNNNHLDYFKFIGRVIGKAICDGHLMDAHFTKSFYKHVLGIPVDYTDIEAIDPIYYKNLKLILTNPLVDMGLDLTFSAEENTFGQNKVFDLIPNGRNIEVTDDNKQDYVRLVAHHLMTRAIRAQIESFLDGFYDLVPPELISIFSPTELELLICGLPDVNIEDLRQHTEYRQYRENDPIIIWFWDILRSFSREEKALFIQFVTGTSKVPLGGFNNLQGMRGIQHFSIHRAYVDVGLLPTAHTCYNQLDLPCYATQEDLRQKVIMAIREGNEGFGFA